MLCYIAVRMFELYERDTSPHKQQTAGRKKKTHPPGEEPRIVGGVPANGKQRIVCLLSQLCELEIVCLWDPPSVQMMENWSGLIGQLCYKLLENSSIGKDHLLRDRVIHLLGVLVRDYGQALSKLLIQYTVIFFLTPLNFPHPLYYINFKFLAKVVIDLVQRLQIIECAKYFTFNFHRKGRRQKKF